MEPEHEGVEPSMRSRTVLPALLLVAFIVVPIAELAIIVAVGSSIGVLETVALLIAVSVLGTWLIRREGRAAWAAFRRSLAEGRAPTREVVDGALVLFAGALLLTPGFLSDLLGLSLAFPPTRAVVSRMIRSRIRTQLVVGPQAGMITTLLGARDGGSSPARRRRAADPLDVEVLDVRRTDEPRP